MDPLKGDVFLDPGLMRGTHKPDGREGPIPPATMSHGSRRVLRIVAAVLVIALFAALFYFALSG